MPAILERCVSHVMDKGYPEHNAWAICRAQLGLKTDGSEDSNAVAMSEHDMKAKIETALQFQNGPVIRKKMIVLHPFGKYENGPDQKGSVTAKRIAGLVERFRKYPRQVPIFMLGDHPESNDERMPTGWVESLSQDKQGNLVAETKLHGAGAEAVGGDLIRGASVYTVQAKDYDGKPIGEVLKHLLLTNEPFDKDTNIAASRAQGGERGELFFTALPKKEAKMADEKPKPDPTPHEKEADLGETIKAKDAEIVKLQAEILGLQEQLEHSGSDEEKESLRLRVARLERKTEAQEIREIVMKGLKRGTLKTVWTKGFDEKGDEGTLAWFKASRFMGEMKLLKYQVEQSDPVVPPLRLTYKSGAPQEETMQLTEEDRALLRKHGIDPESYQTRRSVKNIDDYKAANLQPKGKG